MNLLLNFIDTDDEGVRLFLRVATQTVEAALSQTRQAETCAEEQRRIACRASNEVTKLEAQANELRTFLRIERDRCQTLEAAAVQSTQRQAAPGPPADELDRLRNELTRLTGELVHVRADRDLYGQLVDAAEEERDTAIRRLGRALGRLCELEPDAADPEPEEYLTPATFAEIVDQAAATYPLLAFTLDPAHAARLDDHPKAPAWRRRTVSALATLAAYTEAKAAVRRGERQPGGDLSDPIAFTRHGGPGVHLSAASIALGESRSVTEFDKFASARVFPTPLDVNPAGQAAMYAHIRIGTGQHPAPRLHFLDDTAGSGRLVIGYLGTHLPSKRTT
ncbi:hypothetical protein [Plantactinospora sp. CA-290183]|uniref:hypothetical protein n=1 Tax=Plantactinospora sp. CA-290183 TaxID=3240006 RepID=UPI003D93BE0C